MHRVAFFIDGAYLDNVIQKEFGGKRLDYSALVHAIIEKAGPDRELIRAYYYHCLPYKAPNPTPEESGRFSRAQAFFRRLQRSPRFEVRQGRLAYRGLDQKGSPIFEQKRTDLLLGIDLVILATRHAVDEVFILAGDSDFIPAVQAAKSQGVIVYLVCGDNCHEDLLDEADERIKVDSALINKAVRLL